MNVVFDGTICYDRRFFQSLDRTVQREPWLTRDKAMIDMVKTAGIEKGQPFAPDPKTLEVLDQAAHEARTWLDARYDHFSPPFYENAGWAVPGRRCARRPADLLRQPQLLSMTRGVTYSFAFFSPKHLGAGSFYLMTTKDKDGLPFHGAGTYRLTVPAQAPVSQTAGHHLRPGHPRPDPGPAAVEPLLPVPGPARPTRTDRVDITSGPKRPTAWSRTGFQPAPMGELRSPVRFYGHSHACSTRPGSYPTS